jgi:hypothetical protein
MSLTEDLLEATDGWDDDPLEITVAWDPIKTAANKCRMNSVRGSYRWAGLNSEAKKVARKAWEEAGSPRIDAPVRVGLVVRRGRSMDLANIWGGVKPLLDGLFTNAITPDDSLKWVAELGGVRLEVARDFKGAEEVTFIIERLAHPTPGVGGAGRADDE